MSAPFESLFGRSAAVQAKAHGRVNLIGEHTDYNDGFVLPTPIPQYTLVEISPRDDQIVAAWSANYADAGVQSFEFGGEDRARGAGWLQYVAGVVKILRGDGFGLQGFDLRVESTVPVGSGLSSSAALEVALLRGLRRLFDLRIDDAQIARLGQRVENEFVGARVGIMDQMAASVGEPGTAIFLDARDLTFERITLPLNAELVVVNSGVEHRHSGGDYNTRRAECERACELLGVPSLRHCSSNDLPRIDRLPEPLNRRARHVVTENQRVLDAVAAIRSGDFAMLGALFVASHASQRDDYAVSIPEIDLLVELCMEEPEVYGARLTGGGFGGSIVALSKVGAASAVASRVAEAYRHRVGIESEILVPERT